MSKEEREDDELQVPPLPIAPGGLPPTNAPPLPPVQPPVEEDESE
jgi:hypothetical protein